MSSMVLSASPAALRRSTTRRLDFGLLAVFAATAILAVFFQLVFKRIGYLFTSLGSAALALVLISRVLGLLKQKLDLSALFLFALFFLNTDALAGLTGMFATARMSWLLLIPFLLYFLLRLNSIFRTVAKTGIVLTFVLFAALQIVLALLPAIGVFLSILQRWMFYLAVVVAVVNFALISKEHALSLAFMIVLAGFAASIMLILEYLHPLTLGISVTVFEFTQRAGGLYGHSGSAAFVVAFSALVLCWLGFAGRVSRGSMLLILAVLLWGLGVTFSTQGIVSLVLILLAFILSFFSSWLLRFTFSTAWVLVLAVLLLYLVNTLVFGSGILKGISFSRDNARRVANIQQVFSGNLGTLADEMVQSGRVEHLENSWQKIQQQPWIGYGTGISLLFGGDENKDVDPFRPHNVLMLIWLENGIFAVLLISVILIAILIKNVRQSTPERWFRLLILANLFAYIFARHTLFYYRYGAIAFGFTLAIDRIAFKTNETALRH